MQTSITATAGSNDMPSILLDTERYARCIEASNRIRWDIDRDVIRGRKLEPSEKFLPDSLSLVNELPFLSAQQRRFMSQVQGRSYANIFGLVERFINAKILEVSRDHWFGDQVALEALVRFSDEELKHQELFRRLERLAAATMPAGYRFLLEPNEVAHAVLGKCTWAVLALTCHIEIFTQQHYKQSIEPTESLSPLWKDVFLHHWKEESQHAIMDELEWRRENAKLTSNEREAAIADLIDLIVAVDGLLQTQAAADVEYFLAVCGKDLSISERKNVSESVIQAYRWQYIGSGVKSGRFVGILSSLVDDRQLERVAQALAPLM